MTTTKKIVRKTTRKQPVGNKMTPTEAPTGNKLLPVEPTKPQIEHVTHLNQPYLVDLLATLQMRAKIDRNEKNMLTPSSDSNKILSAMNELGAVLLQNNQLVYTGCGADRLLNALNELIGAVNRA